MEGRLSRRRLAALWSFQVMSQVLTLQAETMDSVVRTLLLSDDDVSLSSECMLISFLLLTGKMKYRLCRLLWTAHPENEIGHCAGFWEREVLNTWEVTKRTSLRWWRKAWRDNFRMSQATFCFLVRRYGHLMRRQSTHLRRTISVPKRLAVALYYLCQGETFQEVAAQFHIGPSTVGVIVHETVGALYAPLARDVIRFPVGRELHKAMRKFEQLSGLPQCAGAVDGTFLRIVKPNEFGELAVHCLHDHSSNARSCVDSDGLFTFVDIGLPGSSGDAAAYNNSQLKHNIDQGRWLNAASWQCHNATVRPYLVGDSAFGLSPTMMKIYPEDGNLTPVQSSFNAAQIRTRRVVECAFGRLRLYC
eukprot:scpid96703/ scgid27899/ Putative nuclease HARBI1; Harbinger transposase-derived nuclease